MIFIADRMILLEAVSEIAFGPWLRPRFFHLLDRSVVAPNRGGRKPRLDSRIPQ